ERHGYGKHMKYELAQLLVKQFSELATRVGLTCKAAQSGEWEVVEPEDDLRATITVTTGGNNPRAARPVDAANTGHRVAPADQRHQTTPRRDAGRQERTARNRALAGRAAQRDVPSHRNGPACTRREGAREIITGQIHHRAPPHLIRLASAAARWTLSSSAFVSRDRRKTTLLAGTCRRHAPETHRA